MKLINKILCLLRITRTPVVRVYDGYGDRDDIIVQGHVLRLSPLPRKHYRQRLLVNFFSLLRLFIVAPQKNAKVRMEWNNEVHETVTGKDGFFKFEWKPRNIPGPGWHPVKVTYLSNHATAKALASAEAAVFMPHDYQYSFISDIDDTFLVSHSSNLLKRLYVLFTRNAQSRQPFEGVVDHYRYLASAGRRSESPNPFFYVSSSEWNLYDYIREFCRKQDLPKGVFLLSELKSFSGLLKTGQGKHQAKYFRIARILTSYPDHRYVLLGDNSQRDPEIYAQIVKDFPGKIFCVYIRNIRPSRAAATRAKLAEIERSGIACCFYTHSREALAHSKQIGLADGRVEAGE